MIPADKIFDLEAFLHHRFLIGSDQRFFEFAGIRLAISGFPSLAIYENRDYQQEQ
jgi:hypothetical protein